MAMEKRDENDDRVSEKLKTKKKKMVKVKVHTEKVTIEKSFIDEIISRRFFFCLPAIKQLYTMAWNLICIHGNRQKPQNDL